MGVCYFMLLIILQGCSSFRIPGFKKSPQMTNVPFEKMTTADYIDHFAALKAAFLQTPGIKVVAKNSGKKYLEKLISEIISKNEIFFKNIKTVNIHLLDLAAPIHFSLPLSDIFISTGLISKYIKHESMLVSVLSYELVRVEKYLYPKRVIVPVGSIELERLLSLGRLALDEKMEIHKWAHYITVRSGFDGEYYLAWLQVQNRNTADFILQVGDVNLINREEALFKSFLIKNSPGDEAVNRTISSKNFYSFLNMIRDKKI